MLFAKLVSIACSTKDFIIPDDIFPENRLFISLSLRGLVNLLTLEFLKWTLPSLNLFTSIVANSGFSQKSVMNRKQCRYS